MLDEKNRIIDELEMKNEELLKKIKTKEDNTDAKFEIIELQQKIQDVESEKMKLQEVISENEKYMKDKEYVINDCNVYIENLTEQLNEKAEELDQISDKMQNNSTINAKDDEIAGLQAELALLHDNQDKINVLEEKIESLENSANTLQGERKEHIERIKQLETDLIAEHEQYTALSSNVAEYNIQVSNLKAELVKRNEEILDFVKIMKNIKNNLHSRGSPLSALINVTEADNEELSWDHGYENFLTPAKILIEKLVDETLEKSSQVESDNDKTSHIRFLDERVIELENALLEKDALIEEFQQKESYHLDLQQKLDEAEREQFGMQTYLNGKLSEIKNLKQELLSTQELNTKNEEKLVKAMSAIQGFVTENLKLSQNVADTESKMSIGNIEQTKQMDLLCLENERLKAELEQLIENNQCGTRAFYMQKGIDKARSEYETNLGDYRGKFDSVLEAWKTSNDNCELMRGRLEELADFLQTVLDSEADVGDLNISSLSVDMRDMLQRSIDESRLLSASILASQTSVIHELSQLGLDGSIIDVEHLGEETWLVPDVNVSVFEDDDEQTVPKKEYDCLLLELRDNLTKRRLAEEELQKLKLNFDNLSIGGSSTGTKTKIPISDGNVKTRGRSGSRRRKTLTKIPGPATGIATEEDDWSEPDKVESRKRIGLEEDEELILGGRSSDEEPINNAEVGAELRRERGRVERLRSEISTSQKREADLVKQLEASRVSLEKVEKKLKKKQDIISKMEIQCQQTEGENEQKQEMLLQLHKEKSELEIKLADANGLVEKLNKGIEWWKTECKKVGEEFEMTGSTQQFTAGQNVVIEELKDQLKKMEVENEKLMQTFVENEVSEYELLKAKYQKKKSELGKMKGTNLLLEERCIELEDVIKSSEAKINEVEIKYVQLQEVKRRQSLILSNNLSQAEGLLKELNDCNKGLKTELEKVKEDYCQYKMEYNDEVIQNRVNEVEFKMQSHSEGMKRMADELLKVEQERRTLESKLLSRSDLLKTAEREIQSVKDSFEKEKYKTEELGKTIEIMRNNIEKLENEKLRKDSLEKEFNLIQKRLTTEIESHKSLHEKMEKLEKSKKQAEEKLTSAEKVLKALSTDSFQENKENDSKYNLSKHELETVLHNSRPPSRRQGLSNIDSNISNRISLPVTLASGVPAPTADCCSHLQQLESVTLERDAALAKLKTTRSSLVSAAEKLNQSNRRKKEMEKEICQQLSKTHQVLRKTKNNLENYSSNGAQTK